MSKGFSFLFHYFLNLKTYSLNSKVFLLLSYFIFQCNAIDERAFKSLETQVGMIQQKILVLHKIKDLEDELEEQKSLTSKKSEEIIDG